MPELPEVETVCRGIAPHIVDRTCRDIVVRQPELRWSIPVDLIRNNLIDSKIKEVKRRGKYILWRCEGGWLLIHLGMTGTLTINEPLVPTIKHDHVLFCFDETTQLRYNDTRRFGAILWAGKDWKNHKLLRQLGPEPLGDHFTGKALKSACHNRKKAIKNVIMDSHVVVGVGNIYASEALFLAGINPTHPAGSIGEKKMHTLVDAIKEILTRAIAQGGSTISDYKKSDGKPGYFAQQLKVYGRTDAPCPQCTTPIVKISQMQRSTWYCPRCQR